MSDEGEIMFQYITAQGYRSYHVDGAYGGLTHKGDLYMGLYFERPNDPTFSVYAKKDGRYEEIRRDMNKPEAVRQVECGLVMDIHAAVAIHEWLGKQIDKFQRAVESSEGD